jgi:hypothetical protein
MNTVFAKVNSAISNDLGKLFDSNGFKAKAAACVDASNLNFIAKGIVKAKLPDYPHGALDYMFTPDSAHPNCIRSGVDTFRKLTGSQKGDGNAQLARLSSTSKEYAANLAQKSAELARHTQVASKVDCSSADPAQVAAKPKDGKTPTISGDPDKKPATLASADQEPKPSKKNPIQKPATGLTDQLKTTPEQTPEQKVVQPDPKPSETITQKVEPASVVTQNVDTVVPEPAPLTPEKAPAEQSAGLSKGQVVGGLAVLGVGAGAAYLIFSKKDKKSDSSGRIPSSTGTTAASATQASTKTQTSSGTSTQTSTGTQTGPASSDPYTGTLTATSVNTDTATSESGSQTSTQTNTSTGTATRE